MHYLGERFYADDELRAAGFKSLGKNVLIKRNVGLFFTENMSIGDNTRIDDFTIIVASREPVSIGRHVHISGGCYISGSDGFAMHDFCTLAPGVKIFSSSDDYNGKKMTNVTLPRHLTGGPAGAVVLEKHVIIGANTTVLPDLTIGEGSSVGAQSLVKKSLPPWGVFAGCPVRRLSDRKKDLLALEAQVLIQA